MPSRSNRKCNQADKQEPLGYINRVKLALLHSCGSNNCSDDIAANDGYPELRIGLYVAAQRTEARTLSFSATSTRIELSGGKNAPGNWAFNANRQVKTAFAQADMHKLYPRKANRWCSISAAIHGFKEA